MSTEYQDILSRARSEIPEPVDIPAGLWRLQAIAGKYTEETSDEELMAEGMIVFKPIEPDDTVDEELVALFADSLEGARIFHRYWLRDLRDAQTLNRLFDTLGMDRSLTIREAVAAVKGYEVMAYVTVKPDPENLERNFINLKQFAPVED